MRPTLAARRGMPQHRPRHRMCGCDTHCSVGPTRMKPRSSVARPPARGQAGAAAPVTIRQSSKPSGSPCSKQIWPGSTRKARRSPCHAMPRCASIVAACRRSAGGAPPIGKVSAPTRATRRCEQPSVIARRWTAKASSSTPAAPPPTITSLKRWQRLVMRSTSPGHAATKPLIGRIGKACSAAPGNWSSAGKGPVSIDRWSKCRLVPSAQAIELRARSSPVPAVSCRAARARAARASSDTAQRSIG